MIGTVARVALRYNIGIFSGDGPPLRLVRSRLVNLPLVSACIAFAAFSPAPARSAEQRVTIVAAENVYGDIARQIAGPGAVVTSILTNPEQDPHLFESSPSTARAVAGARIVLYNGAGYDPWMLKLLSVGGGTGRRVIEVAGLLHVPSGANPHLWYDPAAAPAVASALAELLAIDYPAQQTEYAQRRARFIDSLVPLQAKITAMRSRFAGTPVTATEPVFGDMAAALGLAMRNERFQLAVMNGTEPAASDVAAFEQDLRQRNVRVLIYNSQATDSAARRLLDIARRAHIPVVGVTETEPAGKTYQQWMLDQLDALERALSAPGA